MAVSNIAVIGGGNGSFTMAGDFALAGYRVRMWSDAPKRHETLFQTKTIHLEGLGRQGDANIHLVTADVKEAIKDADVIFSSMPAFTQEKVANIIGPHLEDGQIIFLSPGSFGGYLIGKILYDNGWWKDVSIAEPGTLPYLTRKIGPNAVQVSGLAVRLPVGVFPAKKTEETVASLKELYPAVHPVENSLSIALLNVGPVIHSVLFLLNTGPIEHLPTWDIHNEGTTPSVKKLILALDEERIALRKALGFTSHHYPFSDHYDQNSENEWMYGRKAHTDLVKSEKWRESLTLDHRYIREDVKCNLALIASIGDYCRVETPIADSLLTLIGIISGEDFAKTGRTLACLGLADQTREELFKLLHEGF